LAIGYLNRPEVQALRFIPVPKGVKISHGTHLYRTGDWGYMLSDGRLEICGRCDSMVKIRGYSIEVQVIKQKLINIWYQNFFFFMILKVVPYTSGKI
jgi:non-ribosomal peptide synthetase component F